MVKLNQHVEQLTWNNIREEVKEVNAELCAIIDNLSPDNQYTIYRVRYAYGQHIIKKGVLYLPEDEQETSVEFEHHSLSTILSSDFSYAPIPLIMQLRKSSEAFLDNGHSIIPLNIFSPGNLYGVFEVLETLAHCPTSPIWNVTAGHRSVFMLGKISEQRSHMRLVDEFGIKKQAPATLYDHFEIFKALHYKKNQSAQCDWNTQVIIFSQQWFKKLITQDSAWLNFNYYLSKLGWNQSRHFRQEISYKQLWEEFGYSICRRRYKPSPYVLDTVKHLVKIALGVLPGFYLANGNNMALPDQDITKIYQDIYQLRYAPLIMSPALISGNDNSAQHSIYYSLSYPTLANGEPSTKYPSTLINEIRLVKTLMEMLFQCIGSANLIKKYNSIQKVKHEYFHSNSDDKDAILNSKYLTINDEFFHRLMKMIYSTYQFPTYSPFFKGCIKLSIQKEINSI